MKIYPSTPKENESYGSLTDLEGVSDKVWFITKNQDINISCNSEIINVI